VKPSDFTVDELNAYDLDAGTREHYEDAELYDFEYRRRRADVNHYRRPARDVPPHAWILELGCGTGRLLVPLAKDGHQAVGLDASQAMLSRATTRAARLPPRERARVLLVRGDMRAFGFGARFPLIVSPFNALQHMYTRTDLAACLDEVRRHLAPGGRLAFDVMNPDLRWLTRDPHKRWARTRFKHPVTGVRYEYTTNQTYDPITQIAYMRIYYEELETKDHRTRVVRLAHRQFFPAELEALLASSGFRIDARYGGFDGEPLAGDSESQVVIARLR
jgi:SAM-dependent methyltransferase